MRPLFGVDALPQYYIVRQHQMVVAWIKLRLMKKLKETKPKGQLTS